MRQMKQPRQNQKTRRQRPRLPASVRSKLLDELTEVTRHRAAISEVLRVIASSPHDLQPIFDTIIDSATRLCRADIGGFRLCEREGFRLVAVKAQPHMFGRAQLPKIGLPSVSGKISER